MVVDLPGFRKDPEATRRYHFEEEFPPLILTGEEISFLDPVSVDILLERAGMIIPLKAQINTKIRRTCGCCLKVVEAPVQIDFGLEFVHRKDLDEMGIQLEPGQESDDYEIFEDQPIEMREIVFENLAIAMPMRFVCQADCPGLCPQCGQDLSVAACTCQPEMGDPRLAILKELLESKESQ